MNSDGPQRTPVCPPMSQDACVRVNNSHFYHTKNTVKKTNYGHWTGCNLLPTDSDGIISPDIICMVHKTKGKSIYSKQFFAQLHIIRFQKGSAISRYWVYKVVLYCSAQTRHSYLFPRGAQIPKKGCNRTIPWGLKWSLMNPRERQSAP